MDNNNNSSNVNNTLNNTENTSLENQMPALNKETQAKENIVANNKDIDINSVKSVFEDMNISTQVDEKTKSGELENPYKKEDLDNAPIQDKQANDVQIEIPTPNTQTATQNVEVPQESEFSAKTIGTIKPDTQKSPVAMIVLFSFLFIFMLFMPEVLNFINNTFGTNLATHSGVKIEEVPEEVEEETKITMYDFNDNTVISLDKLTIQSFVKSIEEEGYKLSFTIKNNGTQLYDIKKKLYFEFYDSNSTFIGRAYLENIKQVTGGMTNNYKVNISKDIYDMAKKIELIERTDDDYPSIELVSNQLTCTNDKYNLVYTFDDNQRLTYIKDMYTYTKKDDLVEYNSDLVSYKSKIDNLDRLDGVTAVLTETDTGFMTTIAIDYAFAEYSKLSSDTNYYMKDTYARIIKFEMNAKGYNCR